MGSRRARTKASLSEQATETVPLDYAHQYLSKPIPNPCIDGDDTLAKKNIRSMCISVCTPEGKHVDKQDKSFYFSHQVFIFLDTVSEKTKLVVVEV